jgi:predicted GNAT family acetyltransferase
MDIMHDESEKKFCVKVGENEECNLHYMEINEHLWNFDSTNVPENISEKSLIEKVVEHAINFVKEKNIKILASCSDVQDFLVKHNDLKNIVYHPY